MKEVTYEDWQKNPTPRMMWVWNDDVENKEKLKVAYVLNSGRTYRVLSIIDEDSAFRTFCHCAEIEVPKTRRMTNKELSRWLREKPAREWKSTVSSYVHSTSIYNEKFENEEVSEDIVVREDDGEWRVPLVEIEEWQEKKSNRKQAYVFY